MNINIPYIWSSKNGLLSNGFTIVEVMVAGAILSFGFIAATKAQMQLLQARQSVTMGASAINLADREIEKIQNYSSLAGYDSISGTQGQSDVANTTMSYVTSVNVHNKYKETNVIVSWTDASEETQSILLSTFVSENNPQISGKIFSNNYATATLPIPSRTGSNNTGSSGSDNGSSGSGSNGSSGSGSNGSSGSGSNGSSGSGSNGSGSGSNGSGSGHSAAPNTNPAVTISGTISLASQPLSPNRHVSLSNVTLSTNTLNNITASCTYSPTGSFSCIMGHNWSGRVLINGISDVNVCVQNSQPYINLINSLTSQNYLLVKKNKDCPTSAPHLLQDL